MSVRVVILGAGFGGLELATSLSEELGDDIDVTLIDRNDAFVFGYSKLDVMFGRTTPAAIRLPYRDIAKPGVRFLQQTVTAIDPEARRVTTDARCPTLANHPSPQTAARPVSASLRFRLQSRSATCRRRNDHFWRRRN